MDADDKEWARKYILDPLTAPEPSAETGPGASHYNQQRGSLTYTNAASSSSQPRPQSQSYSHRSSPKNHSKGKIQELPIRASSSSRGYPTPPTSTSPTRSSFHPSNPYASAQQPASLLDDDPPPYSPTGHSPGSGSSSRPARLSPPRSDPHRSASTGKLPSRTVGAAPTHSRNRSLSQRFPGDMSHRPLDIIKRETRVADRPQHRRRRHGGSDTDIIDALDTIGGAYHHGGPYDATLAGNNLNKIYSPVAAVRESNMAAIRATPREYIQDSLDRHIPLQGTSTIPPGAPDMSGRIMDYQEGADLMREADAPGGAYKRWEGLQYHPEDFKGKSEPSYTYERDAKDRKHAHRGKPGEYEMQTGLLSPGGRQRSVSNVAPHGSSSGNAFGEHGGVQRSNTTGKKLSDGLKRRIGSIRGKKPAGEEVY